MTDKEQIEEMTQIMCKECVEATAMTCRFTKEEVPCDFAKCFGEVLYNAGYRKIPENAVVITNEEYKMLKYLEKYHITCEDVYEYVELARKETAKEIYEHIVDSFLMREGNKYFFKKWLQERYGVGYEENN